MKTLSSGSILLVLFCMCIGLLPIALAEEAIPAVPTTTGQLEIYSGSIPSGDGIVSIKAISGKLYQIPAMTPLGVIQALAGTESIENYKIGDELIAKKGILTLDAINSFTNSGEKSWFVLVNDKQLEDYLLPSQEGLNVFPLKNGDTVLFAYGNPTKPASEAAPIVKVVIGAQAAAAPVITPIQTTDPVPTQVSTPVPTPMQTVVAPTVTPPLEQTVEAPILPTTEVTSDVVENESQTSSSKEKDPNQPVFEGDAPVKETTVTETSNNEKDPNQPVYEGDAPVKETTVTETSSKEKDPNQPIYDGDAPVEENSGNETSTNGKDPNQPVYEDGRTVVPEETVTEEPTVESTPAPEATPDEETEADANISSKSSSSTRPSGQEVIFDGSMSLPSGDINITADSGMDYEVGANTPLGLLQTLVTDGKVGSMSVSDRGMRKGNILTIESIGDYQWGDEAWFAQINGATLQDYQNSADGLNTKTFGSGDTITFYYGKLDQSPSSAKAAIYVTID